MKLRQVLMMSFFLGMTIFAHSQQPDTLIKKLDSLSKKTDSAGGVHNNTNPSAYTEITHLTPSSYFILLGSDIKQAFTKPFHLKHRDYKYVGVFVGTTVALSLVDKPVQKFALRLRNDNPTLRNVSKYVTNFGGSYEVATLAGLGAFGFIFKNEKMKTTTLLASQSYITGALVESVVKFITGRQRPYLTDSTVTQARPTFHGPFYKTQKDANGKKLNSSFPSGHTTVAFAAATVYAMEYKNKPIVPIIAYSAATLIGLSRITENKHWMTDVFVGAALGFFTGRLVVNNYHRYAKLKAPKTSLSLNLQYNNGQIMPGFVYSF